MQEFADVSSLECAAVLVDDAINQRKESHLMDRKSLRIYKIYVMPWVSWLLHLVVTLHMALAFVEKPASYHWPTAATSVVEVLFLGFYVAIFVVKWRILAAKRRLYSDKKNLVTLVAIGLTLLDILIAIPFEVSGIRYVRWSRPLRPVFLLFANKAARTSIRDIRKTIPHVLDVLLLVFFLIVFYDLLCVILFFGTEQGRLYFNDPIDGFLSLYVLITTSNFPDVMMPSYTENRLYALVFVSFLVVGLIFLMNFVLAAVYSNYRGHLKTEVQERLVIQAKLLNRAFRLVSEDKKTIDGNDWLKFFRILRPQYPDAKINLLFQIIDEDGDGAIDAVEFGRVVDLLSMSIKERVAPRNVWEKLCGSYAVRMLQTGIRSRWFGYGIDVVILLNTIVLVADFYRAAYNDDIEEGPFGIIFLCIYLVEFALKIFAFGPKGYFKSAWNRFDFFIISITIVDSVLGAFDLGGELTKIIVLVRILRLLRVLGKIPRYALILGTAAQLIPVLASYGLVLIVVYYVFAIVGMEAWAGEIYRDNPALVGTPYAESNYFANNFNSFYEAMILLFELTIVNNWQVNVGGFVAVSNNNRFVWVFFILFHLSSVIVILNIVVAFILETFQVQYSLARAIADGDFRDPISSRIDQLEKISSERSKDAIWIAKQRNQSEYFLKLVFQNDVSTEEIKRALRASRGISKAPEMERTRTKRLLQAMQQTQDMDDLAVAAKGTTGDDTDDSEDLELQVAIPREMSEDKV